MCALIIPHLFFILLLVFIHVMLILVYEAEILHMTWYIA